MHSNESRHNYGVPCIGDTAFPDERNKLRSYGPDVGSIDDDVHSGISVVASTKQAPRNVNGISHF